jgi:hypothetical protein
LGEGSGKSSIITLSEKNQSFGPGLLAGKIYDTYILVSDDGKSIKKSFYIGKTIYKIDKTGLIFT